MADSPRLEELRRRVQADPASIAFAALAEEYRRAGKFREAVDASRAGLRYHPTYVSARVTLGRSLVELQEVEQAERELTFVLKSAPDNLAARRALGELCWQQLRFSDALTHFRTAHTLAPADAELPQILQSLERELAADRNGASSKPEDTKAEEAKAEEAKVEDAKVEEAKPEVVAGAAPAPASPPSAAAPASFSGGASQPPVSEGDTQPSVSGGDAQRAAASAETLKLVRPEPVELQRADEPSAEPQPVAAAPADVVEARVAEAQFVDAPPVESRAADAPPTGADVATSANVAEAVAAFVEAAPVEAVGVDAPVEVAVDASVEVAGDAPVEVAFDAAHEEDTAEFAQFEPVAFVEHDEDPHADQGHAEAATEIEYVQHVDAVEHHGAAAGVVGVNGQAHVVHVARPVPNPALVRLERFHRAILAARARRRAQGASSESSDGQAPRL